MIVERPDWWFLSVVVFSLLGLLLAIGLAKMLGEFLHSKFMRKYVSERMYDVAMGVIIGQLFMAAIATPIIALIWQGILR